jgi:sigma-B regulation protein RsbU (phosphoserine phosphatase)
MQATGHQLALVLENVRLYAKLDESRRSIAAYSRALDKELEKGRNIQQGFLPERLPSISGWEIDVRFSPAYQVAGDFYDVFFLEDGCLGLVIADVCDKGVGSALFMGLFRSLIRIFSGQALPVDFPRHLPKEISPIGHPALSAVSRTNDYIAAHHGWMGMFATLFFGVLNPHSGSMAYINGGHEPPMVIGEKGVKAQLGTTGPAVGSINGVCFGVQAVEFAPGDVLVGYTDGVSEACSHEKALYGKARLRSILDTPAASAAALLDRVEADLLAHTAGAPQSDDITLLAVRRTQ